MKGLLKSSFINIYILIVLKIFIIGMEDGRNKNIRLRLELFGERCESCRYSTLYVDNMSIIVKTANEAARTAMKIELIIAELGKILHSNSLILNADKWNF